MIRECALVLLAFASGVEPAKSDLFRCAEEDGSLRFSDRPEVCARAKPHPLRGRRERMPTSGASPEGLASSDDSAHTSHKLRLEEVLPAAAQVRVAWDVVNEAPSDPKKDPDLVRWGVRAQLARHYTRHSSGAVQVCSMEAWRFEDISKARTAHENFAYPGWKMIREGSLLLMLRGLTRMPGEPSRRGVFAACHELGERARARARRLVREYTRLP
jgi:hypothetical protein